MRLKGRQESHAEDFKMYSQSYEPIKKFKQGFDKSQLNVIIIILEIVWKAN